MNRDIDAKKKINCSHICGNVNTREMAQKVEKLSFHSFL